MIRKPIIVLLTVSALLGCAMWPLSCLAPIRLTFGPFHQGFEADCNNGQATLKLALPIDAATFNALNLRPYSLTGGFGCGSQLITLGGTGQGNVHVRIRQLHAPVWAVVLLFGAYPAIALIRQPARRRRYRREHGLCVKCGYDLTGNVSGTCPECGGEVKQP